MPLIKDLLDQVNPPSDGTPVERCAEWILHHTAPHLGLERAQSLRAAPLAKGAALSVTAEINHGRWLANCPTPGCHAACYVTTTDPRFMCPVCGNVFSDGAWVKVKFPRKDVLEALETLLARREPKHQNWMRGEALAQVSADNEAHGLPGDH